MSTKCALHTLLQILLMLRVISTPFRQFRLRPLATHSTNTVCYCFTLTTPDTKKPRRHRQMLFLRLFNAITHVRLTSEVSIYGMQDWGEKTVSTTVWRNTILRTRETLKQSTL
uniref:Putative secreted protein n=1 Tax=Anopheles darlingi TaxID=43151 RepID=A0A2M4D065_ANODA